MASDWKSFEPVLIPDIPNLEKIEVYEKNGGYESLKNVVTSSDWTPEGVVNEVKAANIRGRGGAGFNAGLKWSFMPKPDGGPRYLACNGDESEPGTFKDRKIFEYNPHLFIEGALIAAYAMQITTIYVYVRGEYISWVNMMEKALQDARDKGYIGKNLFGTDYSVEFEITYGAGAYICGEETSMLESLEGKRGYPRVKPPFPAQKGLWGRPTTINNIETLANVPLVIKNGADWFKGIGAESHPGPVLYGISGHVNRPGVYELPTGVPVMDLINDVAQGIRGGKKLKALIPGGSSTPVLRADQLENTSMDSDSLREAGSMMGTAGMIVMDEDTDMVDALWRISHFYHHESCGQCTPCREGTGWAEKILLKIKNGDGEIRDLDLLLDLTTQMEGRTICALADAAAWPIRHTINRFRDEFEARCKKSVHAVA
ncbi:MAG: NADH-quinone oxidoreductase subunit NuoF [Gracilimonas sp.]|uniref:NADH-quinone oxidoreductase subunit NuoF n=1 Tax=Gracilimonas TaxID=649462 RepID=UPI001B0A985A|nr:NADH-quinone oxidoreductase subunit NuoF [Gracilimonas sp.]MBO6586504.1 NADH-quinone oxidoreductase subunit NuoF [Gracilimonas sp.]MBO6615161.1 NADH-quinone oxidoreductase subunit NuoF [Gracilimonas sp.]